MKNMVILGLVFNNNTVSSCKPNKDVIEKTSVKTESSDPLPSWNDVASKNKIIAYVTEVTI